MIAQDTLRSIITGLMALLGGYVILRATSSEATPYVPGTTPQTPQLYFDPATGQTVVIEPQSVYPQADWINDLYGTFTGSYGENTPLIGEADFTPRETAPESELVSDTENNLRAFAEMTGRLESNGSYTALVGGGELTDFGLDFSNHPAKFRDAKGQRIWKGWRRPDGRTTFAAGKYQATESTWDDYLARGRPVSRGFSPAEQDAFFYWKLKDRGAYAAVAAGRWDEAFKRLSNEWEAFQRILAGDYHVDVAGARALYAQAGGTFT